MLYWNIVGHRIFQLVLLCSFLLTSVFSAGEARAWVCDGRICSTADACCCDTPESRDPRCRLQSSAVGANSLCSSGCACELVVKAAPHLVSLPTLLTFAPAPSLLSPLPFCCFTPVISQVILLPSEARGPPPGAVALAIPSLRAPPAA